ncbi:NRDE family protein [Psychrobium sp. 1_MG-2023]|uniref:NRDE family protein n=1 Tax=Psychrobium sp. 1_MG-2023 TaxID=3062624 RepID=UPI000C31D36D|nr:NRDE family protein [Psychrobium sp. 1_MG-2023]MDP2560465.1 NRDE family protein [Psychrobium sp. 1_MG-2023]PKF57875.1 hypothetical protein CW748_04985 [Alteromonadales bacterium alter-6D02]
MCILFVAYQVSKKYPLIIVANRDEFHHRATKALHQWPDSSIIAGKDLVAGGTWFGFTAQGKIAALTNVRDPESIKTDVISRGQLVTNFLTSTLPITEQKLQLRSSANHYNGYNLLFGNLEQLQVFNSHTLEFKSLAPGIHGLSNAQLDTPWPKVIAGKQMLKHYLSQQEHPSPLELANLMTCSQRPEDQALPSTGVSIELERLLSSVFITSDEYGTRSTSVLLYRNDDNISCHEFSYNPLGQQISQQQISLLKTKLTE